jgi:hypothetical protein
VVRVRLERNVGGAAARGFAGSIQRDRFRVLDRFKKIEAFAGNRAARVGDYTTDKWPRTHLADTFDG